MAEQYGENMKLDALDHPKTLDFAARLNIELPTAIGHLELLWAFTGKKASQGNVGKWPDGSIARACYWNADPAVFIKALVDSGFLNTDPEHRLLVHDWQDHAMGWVRAKLKKVGLEFLGKTAEPSLERSLDGSSEPSLEPSLFPTQGREGKGREAKGSEGKGDGDANAPPPPGLDELAWTQWLDYRKQIRKPLKPVSIPAAQKALAAYGSDQNAVVEQSIANSWAGLFPLKNGGTHATHQHDKRSRAQKVSDKLDEIARRDIAQNGFTDHVD